MPDISMCKNVDCPQRKKCYRFMAVPSNRQSYTCFEPEGRDGLCKRFIKIEKRDKLRSGDD